MGIQRAVSQVIERTVSATGTESLSFDPSAWAKGSVSTPSTFDGTAFHYEVSMDGTTWNRLKDVTGTNVTSTTATLSETYPMPGEVFSHKHVRIKCETTQSTTDTILTIVMSG